MINDGNITADALSLEIAENVMLSRFLSVCRRQRRNVFEREEKGQFDSRGDFLAFKINSDCQTEPSAG